MTEYLFLCGQSVADWRVRRSRDPGEVDVAHRMRLLSEGIAQAEATVGIEGVYVTIRAGDVDYFPPTGPGTPTAMPPLVPGPDNETMYGAPYSGPVPLSRARKQRTAAEARADAEIQIRNLLARDPGMSRQGLMRAGISTSDVDHWRPKILQEMGIETPKSRHQGRLRSKIGR